MAEPRRRVEDDNISEASSTATVPGESSTSFQVEMDVESSIASTMTATRSRNRRKATLFSIGSYHVTCSTLVTAFVVLAFSAAAAYSLDMLDFGAGGPALDVEDDKHYELAILAWGAFVTGLRKVFPKAGLTNVHVPDFPDSFEMRKEVDRDLRFIRSFDMFLINSVWTWEYIDDTLDLYHFICDVPDFTKEEPCARDKGVEYMRRHFSDDVLSMFSADGKLIGLPWHINIGVLYYNLGLLRAIPQSLEENRFTYQELLKVGRARRPPDGNGLVFAGKKGEDLFCIGLELLHSHGSGNIVNHATLLDTGRLGHPNFSMEKAEEAWTMLRSFTQPAEESIASGCEEMDYSDAIKAFADGKSVFLRGWTNDVDDVIKGTMGPGGFGWAKLPGPVPGSGKSAASGWGLAMSKYILANGPKSRVKAAIDLMKQFLNINFMADWVLSTHRLPTLKTMWPQDFVNSPMSTDGVVCKPFSEGMPSICNIGSLTGYFFDRPPLADELYYKYTQTMRDHTHAVIFDDDPRFSVSEEVLAMRESVEKITEEYNDIVAGSLMTDDVCLTDKVLCEHLLACQGRCG